MIQHDQGQVASGNLLAERLIDNAHYAYQDYNIAGFLRQATLQVQDPLIMEVIMWSRHTEAKLPESIVEPGYIYGLSRCWERVRELGLLYVVRPGAEISFLRDKKLLGNFAYIRRGCLRSFLRLADGSARLKLVVDEGCLIYDAYSAAGFFEHEPFHLAKTCTELICFDGRHLHDDVFLHAYPELIANVLKSTAVKYTIFDALLDCAYRKTALAKLAWYLAAVCKSNGYAQSFRPHLSQGEVGSLLTLSRASTTRAVQALKTMGILDTFTKNAVVIRDRNALFELAGRKMEK